MGSEREVRLQEAIKVIDHYGTWVRESLAKYDETGEEGHLTGAANGIFLLHAGLEQILAKDGKEVPTDR